MNRGEKQSPVVIDKLLLLTPKHNAQIKSSHDMIQPKADLCVVYICKGITKHHTSTTVNVDDFKFAFSKDMIDSLNSTRSTKLTADFKQTIYPKFHLVMKKSSQ
jgi:hypothetical protein